MHEKEFVAIGGRADTVVSALRTTGSEEIPDLKAALTHCMKALETATGQNVSLHALEVALLDRTRTGRKFRRVGAEEAGTLLS